MNARTLPLLGLTIGAPVMLSVAFASCAGGAWLSRRAAARAARQAATAVEGVTAPSFDQRSVVVAELLLASLREDGARTLTLLPQAGADEQRRDPLAVHEKVVVIAGTVRDLRFERGLFTGRMKMVSGADAYFVTPIAIDGVAVDRRCSFRGMPVAVPAPRAASDAIAPKAILIGAFDGC